MVMFRQLAVMNFGGTKPQNISALNSARGGKVWLLSAQPPAWKKTDNPPVSLRSIFTSRGQFQFEARVVLTRLLQLLSRSGEYTNQDIRKAQDGYVDALIDTLFTHASTLQQERWQGWTQDAHQLPPHQQLWLDPWRCKTDDAFRQEREKNAWQEDVANDFARWLNHNLRQKIPDVAKAEFQHWKTRPLFRQRMREMEAVIQEVLQ